MEKSPRDQPDQGDEFYETMPLTASHYVYRDDTLPDSLRDRQLDDRRTAIITLILVLVVAVALGLLFARGLQIIGESPTGTATTSGSFEP